MIVNNILITIIVPNYNKSKYLEETINSIKSQNSNNWECIIVDDKSTDESIKTIKKTIKNDDRFLFISQKINRGASYCRNLGIKYSQGNYIVFLDSDDVISGDFIFNRLKIFKLNLYIDFAVFPMGTFYEKLGDNNFIWNNFKGNHLNRFLSHDLPWALCSVIWKKESLNRLGGFNEDFVRLQDVELHTKALLNNFAYTTFSNFIPDCFYRIDNNRINNYLQHCLNDVNGKLSYIDFFTTKILKKVNRKFLRGTYFECYSLPFNLYYFNKISKSDLLIILSSIATPNFKYLFNFSSDKIINLYCFLRINRIYFKGMDRIFKYLFLI
tara:strand:+ start:967 stop:1944 length:978 start_codon:yes stop_codon:yes gene_type:complete